MSLLAEAYENFIMMDRQTRPDGYGGIETTWTEGAEIQAAVTYNSSVEALTAQAAGATALYTITTTKAVNLQYHDVIKRARDGKFFRVTSDGDDNFTPASATLDMRQVQAEEYTLPA